MDACGSDGEQLKTTVHLHIGGALFGDSAGEVQNTVFDSYKFMRNRR